jgi:hypothetical protein
VLGAEEESQKDSCSPAAAPPLRSSTGKRMHQTRHCAAKTDGWHRDETTNSRTKTNGLVQVLEGSADIPGWSIQQITQQRRCHVASGARPLARATWPPLSHPPCAPPQRVWRAMGKGWWLWLGGKVCRGARKAGWVIPPGPRGAGTHIPSG